MATEDIDPRFADLDLLPTRDAVAAMLDEQLAASVVQSQVEAIARSADEAAARLADPGGRLIYVGAGTSGRLAVLDGVELGPTFGWERDRLIFLLAGGTDALVSSVEGVEDDGRGGEEAMNALLSTPSDVVIGVAASGHTSWTVAAVRTAADAGALTVGIASNAGTPLLESVAHPILLETGPEVIAGSTRMKAGTAQKIALNLFSTAVMLRLGRVHKGRMVAMRPTNRKLRVRAVEMVRDIADTDERRAEKALDQAKGDIRLAVLIALDATPDEAAAALQAAGGNLRTAIDRLFR
jgi:N-acetylmuramic acid 6-phosphate etherase